MDHRIRISPAKRRDGHGNTVGRGKSFVTYNGEIIGETGDECGESARWLIANGHACADDTLTTYRDDTPCLSGRVGSLATLTVREDDQDAPMFVKWSPMSEETKARLRARGRRAVSISNIIPFGVAAE